ncbi:MULTISPECIES: tetratricopeptide repeat protein [unclassified Coleofasciculus]|uniref:tetratricopeptide repeat protein n=1 Tax=unclassified Coleofasciculus TaxID=2692782 RepID=UPI00187E6F03|nr:MULTISPECIES: tetratricopeptide repeat protein [unclassified Coleofasciculus]MBE9126571.1 tetratricopeptide repeat protein [Coleofasciculus sp. LEGE 07081]MBE9149948.1 tetratricopeptide repeat protein [Coleofasciculus sp. LEGE 07092]
MTKIIGLGIAGLAASIPIVYIMPAAYAQTVPAAVREGFSLLGQGRVQDAIAAFEQAVQRYPQSLDAKLGLAIAYRRQGLIEQAWNAYQRVLAQDPTNELALKSIGLFGTYRSEWQVQGIEALTTLLNLNPNDTEARALRAQLYGYQQRFAEALADYQIVLRSNTTPNVLLGAAETYTNSGNPQQGLELFNRYLASGNQITGYPAIAYASALRETGNPAGAVQVLEAQLRAPQTLQDPNLAILIRAALSQSYLANQQPNEALAVLAPLQGNPNATLPLARSLNEIRNQTGNTALTEQVANLYRQALAQTPNPEPRLLREIADIFSGIPGEQQTALQFYRQLLALQPSDRSLLVKQVALENELGLISQAELRARLLSALQPLPTDPTELRQVAQSLAAIDPPGPEFLPIYASLLQAGVNAPFLNFRIAQLLLQNNDLSGARRALAAYSATPEGANDLAPQLLAAEIERREGNLEASAQRYQGLIASNPPDRDILNAALQGLSGVRLQQNRPVEALAVFDQLIARNPQDATLQLARASLAYEAELISESQAEAVLNYWLQTQPTTTAPPELFNLVAALPADPRREALYDALLQFDPSNIPVQIRAIQAIAQRSPEQARVRVAQLVARDPSNIRSYFLQGEVAQAIDDLDLAEQAYELILSAQPDNREALSALGGVRFRQRRFEDASNLYSQALALNPNDIGIRQALIGLKRVQDFQLEALADLEVLQVEQIQRGGTISGELSRQRQQIQEDFLQRRGFQPPWERY